MNNWRAMKTAGMIILGVSALILFGAGGILGIESLSDKLFNTFTWSQVIGAGLIYAIWAFNKLMKGN